ncbi:hypothetical protein A4L_07 [Anabaena phage A-4L]|uniref:Uncharacterized protein n=1 Tax=Anabaena phage A-4L TaxID=1357732 RepID=A0A059PY20_9CAUD|nr:hypothetical protein A4L_07 [Anabaena phage A-4L]AGR48534.1 hypothetical protein A4L_07 [Anabaena phage A-4L]
MRYVPNSLRHVRPTHSLAYFANEMQQFCYKMYHFVNRHTKTMKNLMTDRAKRSLGKEPTTPTAANYIDGVMWKMLGSLLLMGLCQYCDVSHPKVRAYNNTYQTYPTNQQ